jgi:hypothetical protein
VRTENEEEERKAVVEEGETMRKNELVLNIMEK